MKTAGEITPTTYLSTALDQDGERYWCAIGEGMPLCAHTTKDRAEYCIYNLTQFPKGQKPMVWDGENGAFVNHDEIGGGVA